MDTNNEKSTNPFAPLEREINKLNETFQVISESITKQVETAAFRKMGQEQRVRERLKASIKSLEIQLREREASIYAKEDAIRRREESLRARIHDLENQIKVNERLLEAREAQLKKMKSYLLEPKVFLPPGDKYAGRSGRPRRSWKQVFRG